MRDRLHRGVLAAGILLGIGMGGFFDGILFHQLLLWHQMLSSRIPPDDIPSIHYNMRWDGAFHAFAWLVTAAGVAALWRSRNQTPAPHPTRAFTGAALLGWGLFNIVEGTLNHHILGLHHVRSGPFQGTWDAAFLLAGGALALLGLLLVRSGERQAPIHDGPRPSSVPAP